MNDDFNRIKEWNEIWLTCHFIEYFNIQILNSTWISKQELKRLKWNVHISRGWYIHQLPKSRCVIGSRFRIEGSRTKENRPKGAQCEPTDPYSMSTGHVSFHKLRGLNFKYWTSSSWEMKKDVIFINTIKRGFRTGGGGVASVVNGSNENNACERTRPEIEIMKRLSWHTTFFSNILKCKNRTHITCW